MLKSANCRYFHIIITFEDLTIILSPYLLLTTATLLLLWYIDTLHTINQHIDKVLENAPTKLKVSVNINDADWQKIQELFAKERQWMTAQMQTHIREVNSMFADERKKVRERYKEYDGCYLGYYAQWFFWFFFTIGIFVVAGGIGMMIAQSCGK